MNSLLPILQGAFPPAAEFIPALVVGLLFGIALEVSGFGNAKNLAGQFYFHDMRVFKVMFTAIITTATGIAVLSALGLLNIDALYIPETFLIPHLVGGFILGAGFMVSAYCPGTSIVGAASGKWDGVVTVIGVIAGSALFGEIYPLISGFYDSTAKGVLTFPKLLGIPFPVLAIVVVIVAIGAFFGVDKVEPVFAKRFNMPSGTGMTGSAKKALTALFSVGVIAVILQFALTAGTSTKAPDRIASVTPVELAQLIIEDPSSMYIVDVRKQNEETKKESIPRSVRYEDIKDNLGAMYKGKTMVVYSQDGKGPLPDRIFGYKGHIETLRGGYDGWKTNVLGQPEQQYQAALSGMDNGNRKVIAAIHASFTGAKIEAPSDSGPKPAPTIMAPAKKRGGCS